MSAALKARIARLEQHRQPGFVPRLIYGLHGKSDEGIIGYRTGRGLVAMRMPAEPLDALEARAWALDASVTLEALYRPQNRPVVDAAEPSAAPASPAEPKDPWALAGIGRQATVEELLAMGAIRTTPERLI